MVGVAQLVEPQIVDLVVVGSSPIVHPTSREGGRPALPSQAPALCARGMAILHPHRLAFRLTPHPHWAVSSTR